MSRITFTIEDLSIDYTSLLERVKKALEELSKGKTTDFLNSELVNDFIRYGIVKDQIIELVSKINFSYDLFVDSNVKQADELAALVISECDDFWERFKELCEIFNVKETKSSLAKLYYRILLLNILNLLIKNLKYSINIAFNRFTRTDEPECPKGFFQMDLFPHALRKRIQCISSETHRKKRKNEFLMNTVFQGWKKGFLPMRDEDIVQNLLGTSKDLATSKDVDPTILKKFEQVVDRFLKRTKLFDIAPKNKTKARISSHSTFEYGRGSRGSLGMYWNAMYGSYGSVIRTYEYVDKVTEETRGTIRYFLPVDEGYFYGYVVKRTEAFEVRTPYPFIDRDFMEYENTRAAYKSLARPAAILEPMKVRVITAGSVGQATPLKEYQSFLWKKLFRHDAFKYIGQKVDLENIKEFIDYSDIMVPNGGYCSGDYSGATNKLKGTISRVIAERIFSSRMFFGANSVRERILKSLLSTTLHMEKINFPHESSWRKNPGQLGTDDKKYFESLLKKYNIQTVEQISGQLMGNILSFPILCMANYCAFHTLLELFYEKEFDIFEYPTKINGDDILFKCERKFYDFWFANIHHFGFEPSLGKNLYSDDLLQINSQLYRAREIQPDDVWCGQDILHAIPTRKSVRKIGFANFGLLTNRKKNDCENNLSFSVKYSDEESGKLLSRAKGLPSLYRDYVLQCEGLPSEANSVFMKHISAIKLNYPDLPYELLKPENVEDEYFFNEVNSSWNSFFPTFEHRWEETSRYLNESQFSFLEHEIDTVEYSKKVKSLCKLDKQRKKSKKNLIFPQNKVSLTRDPRAFKFSYTWDETRVRKGLSTEFDEKEHEENMSILWFLGQPENQNFIIQN